jgi:type I restriction enzyme M protein
MNMIMHDVHYKKFDIYNEDTLVNPSPKHIDERFEAIVANPPFSANWKPESIISDDRFSPYGKMAPKSKADFAFVQHMIHQLDDNGTMACVLPHGVLFRGAAEGHIRKYLIEDKNQLDAVIGLPSNIFFGTSIPTCILVLKKNRNDAKDILFIDASNHFEKVKTQNVLTEVHLQEIIETYRTRKTKDKYSYVATLEKVKENDYNLNIPRYVDTFEEDEPVILEDVAKDLKSLESDIAKTDSVITDFCKELNIETPF